MKIKGSQGKPRVEWVFRAHPFTAMSSPPKVHANHLEAFNSALRRRATAYRRRQNHYAKRPEGLQRALNVQKVTTQLSTASLGSGQKDHSGYGHGVY